jgi:hypothetical protein
VYSPSTRSTFPVTKEAFFGHFQITADKEAKKKYPKGFKTLKPYLRTLAQPE